MLGKWWLQSFNDGDGKEGDERNFTSRVESARCRER